MNIEIFEKWRALMRESYRDRIEITAQPWYSEFKVWVLGPDGQEVLARASEFFPDTSQPVEKLVDKDLMRELNPTETIQVGDILHFRNGRALVVQQHSHWVTNSLAQPPLEVRWPIKVWRLKPSTVEDE